MDYSLDTSWCPVCNRQIDPKRYQVPVPPPPPPPSESIMNDPSRRNKNTTNRTRGGLVHGTGRVKLNGTIKRANSPTPHSTTIPDSPPKPSPPIKHRTVIDQSPIPLYCSDECKMADINYIYGTIALNYDPARASPPLPPVPHNSLTGLGALASESESDTSSSVESRSSKSSSSTPMSPSIATLAKLYNFPPLPPPAPVILPSKVCDDDDNHSNDYQSGVMMAGRLLKETLCSERPKSNIYGQRLVEPRKPIPGWTDGSTAWRSAVYNFSSPSDMALTDPTQKAKAYQSFRASPHRSRGIHSTLGENALTSSPPVSNSVPARATEVEELYSKYSLSFSRRSDSRTSIPSSPSSQSFPASSRRERSLLKPGAEGKLLVPDVKLRVHSSSSASLSSAAGPWTASSYPATSRRSVKSPLSYRSHWNEDDPQRGDDGDIATSLSGPKRRPAVEERSWSYDNLKTYPVMQLPPTKEKRVETQVVDGREVEVEVEVEVVRPLKRLFLFPGKATSLERR